ncbi:MAG: HEPN domain-containing protein [Anaerolineales bacterium]|nr:HEPN domain-containing protein [Anaerolineales bacterium]
MSDPGNPLAWVEYAEQDYQTAIASLRRKRPFASIVCFHAQQCAEKCLKAILVAKNQEFPKIHDLQGLNDLCTRVGVIIPVDPDRLDGLTFYAARVRYPGNEPTIEEARDAVEIARAVRRFARQFLGVR